MVLVRGMARHWGISFAAAGLLALALLLALGRAPVAWAHESVTVGDYTVEYGWVSEPAVAGQPNAVVINVSAEGAASGSEVDVSGLKVQAAFGGQSKALTLQPLGENTPGQFIAAMTPMRPGIYTIHLGGSIGATAFNTDVKPEEVQTADVVQFPVAAAGQASDAGGSAMSIAGLLGVAGFFLGALGTVLGLIALARRPAKT